MRFIIHLINESIENIMYPYSFALVSDKFSYAVLHENADSAIMNLINNYPINNVKTNKEVYHQSNIQDIRMKLTKVSDILKEYYTVITKKLRKKIEDANNDNIENYSVNGDDFLYFCKEEPYVLNYFELRANFIKFAKDKVNNTIRKEKI